MRRLALITVMCAFAFVATPVMADFVDFFVYDTGMTITPTGDMDGTTATGEINNAMFMNVNIKDDDGFVQETLALSSADFDIAAVLNFTGSGNDYSATGSLAISDADGLKVAADFMSSEVTFNMAPSNYLEITGYLSPQGTNASILLGGSSGSTWDFVGPTETISLVGNIASFNFGDMLVIRYNVPYNSLQSFFQNSTVLMGTLNATVMPMPIPAAVVLGILGMGVVGLKLRKFT